MPELPIPDTHRGAFGPGLILSTPDASVSIAIAEGREDDSFAADRNAQAALHIDDNAYVLATGRIAFIRLGIELLANLRVQQIYPSR